MVFGRVTSLDNGETRGRFVGSAGLAQVPLFLAAAGPAPQLGWRLDPAVLGWDRRTQAVAGREDAVTRLAPPGVIWMIHPDITRS